MYTPAYLLHVLHKDHVLDTTHLQTEAKYTHVLLKVNLEIVPLNIWSIMSISTITCFINTIFPVPQVRMGMVLLKTHFVVA